MAKKSNNKKVFLFISVLCALIAIGMFFVPMVIMEFDGYDIVKMNIKASFTGFQMITASESCKVVTTTVFGSGEGTIGTGFVLIPLISAICIVIGLIATLASSTLKKNSKVIAKFIALLTFVAAAVLTVAFTKNAFLEVNVGDAFDAFGDTLENVTNLGIGAYLVCGFSGLAGLTALLA